MNWASEHLSQSLSRGKMATQCLRGPRRNPKPYSRGLQVDRTQDWKMCMIKHYLPCIFVYLSPPSENMSSGVGEGQKSGVLQSMVSQRVGHDWANGLDWTDQNICYLKVPVSLNLIVVSSSSDSCSDAKLCLTLFDSTECSTPDFPVPHYLPVFAQTHVRWVSYAM